VAGLTFTAPGDAGAYLARLVRLDSGALVRLRPGGGPAGVVALWAPLPFGPLVTRGVAVRNATAGDVTVRARELLDVLGPDPVTLPESLDARWRWPLPPAGSRAVERLPAAEVRRIGAAAADALREAAATGVRGRAVGERMLRDALLDHVPIVVTAPDDSRVEVPQRLVQAVVRMGFAGSDRPVDVLLAGAWVGLAAEFGTAWHRGPGGLAVRPVR
jgi:hypothetical protein